MKVNNKRYQFIQKLIDKNKYQSYLEIGVRKGITFKNIKIAKKEWIDPQPIGKIPNGYKMTSDDFFAHIDTKVKWDIVFIDGLHYWKQVVRDINNSLDHLDARGTIVVHDCNPQKEIEQRVPRETGRWNGDVWKAIVELKSTREDLDIYVVDTDEGLGIIKWGKQDLLDLDKPIEEIGWDDLVNNRKKYLSLISLKKGLEK